MKPALSLLAALLTSFGAVAVSAAAPGQPVALDYRASDASCPDAAHFADQVSAKLGAMPWSASAPARITVRIGRGPDGEGFAATFQNIDGARAIFDGASCAEVSANVVLAVALALDPAPAAPAAPTGAVLASLDDGALAQATGMFPVTFVSARGSRIDVSAQDGGGVGVASNGQMVSAMFYRDLCTTPCVGQLPRGRTYLAFSDPDAKAFGGGAFVIDGPTTITLRHRSRSGLRRGLFVGGAIGLAVGIAAFALPSSASAGTIIVGALGVSVGSTLMLAPVFIHDALDATQSP